MPRREEGTPSEHFFPLLLFILICFRSPACFSRDPPPPPTGEVTDFRLVMRLHNQLNGRLPDNPGNGERRGF